MKMSRTKKCHMKDFNCEDEDDINATTWLITFQQYHHCEISFKHLKIISENDLITRLNTYEPRINGTLPDSEQIKKNVFSFSVDLSRNFFTTIRDIDMILNLILKRLTSLLHIESDMSMCKTICLTSNDLTEFPIFTNTQSLLSLEELYLCHNNLEYIPTNTSASLTTRCPNLRVLDLRNNRLSSLSNLQFLLNDHPQLEHLSLSCNLVTFHTVVNDLPSCPKLRILGLFNNDINLPHEENSVDTETLANILAIKFPNLEDLYLQGNPLVGLSNQKLYQDVMQRFLPKLHWLDGIFIKNLMSNIE